MGKKQQKKESVVHRLSEGQKYKVDDFEHKSKAFVPIQVDAGYMVEIVQVDGGLLTGLPKGEPICDNLICTVNDKWGVLNITWVIELKGTKNQKEANHAIEQITKSIQYMQEQTVYPEAGKYIRNRDYVFAAVAGAPDKTLPIMNNQELKALCQKLKANSVMRKKVKDMFALFCYIRPNPRYKNAEIGGNKPPYEILCYHNSEGYIPYPSMLMKLLEKANGGN